jgi:transcriptional regulator
LRAIVGVEVRISRVEAKWKLSQNRSAEDVDGVVRGFLADGRPDLAAAVDGARRPDGP